MRTTQFQNNIFCRGSKLYNNIMFGNIFLNNSINNINMLKKTLKNYL